VRLATLFADNKRGSLLDREAVGFEVPVRVRLSSGRLREKIGKCRGEWRDKSERDVLAEIRSHHGVEGGRVAFVEGHDLGGG
jgi:hypothetical protein